MIVNTRPADLSQHTNSLLEKSKQNFIHIPLTKIVKIDPPLEALQHINSLQDYDALIFTSQSSVTYGYKFLQETSINDNNILTKILRNSGRVNQPLPKETNKIAINDTQRFR